MSSHAFHNSQELLLEELGFLSLEEYNPLPPNLLTDGGKEWLMSLLPTNALMSKEELYRAVVGILQKDGDGEELLDLIGFEGIDLITKILNYKSILLSTVKMEPGVTSTRQLRRMQDKGIIPKKFSEENKNMRPILLPTGPQFDPTSLPGIFLNPSSIPGIEDLQMGGGGKLNLPKNSTHHQDIHWEEFVLYPDEVVVADGNQTTSASKDYKVKRLMDKIKRIEIVQLQKLHPLFSSAFPESYKTLNPMQSATFPILTGTNENVLVCAPTGAGKTDVALLSILKLMMDNYSKTDGNLSVIDGLENLKIVYVAPMKALAAEITGKFQKRLLNFVSSKGHSFRVREYTGDMQLTPQEVRQTQMIVTTPEKWDVLTRKPSALSVGGEGEGGGTLLSGLSLLIIDEIHLLQDSRGPVIEAIVARTLRRVELQQKVIRLIGLSATLPNYMDVGTFLRVDPYQGLFAFGEQFRPVPLTQHFIGCKPKTFKEQSAEMTRICWEKVKESVNKGYQAMVFVHSRNETVKTVKALQLRMIEHGLKDSFSADASLAIAKGKPLHKLILQTKDRELVKALSAGFGFHHAGMPRQSRRGVEDAFSRGDIKVLCCTSTLAWGVNLPAHTVIIKGTRVYDQQKGDFGSLGILDVLQIFGRAGRPQFQETGEAFLICPHSELSHYLRSILHQIPIESRFLEEGLYDNFNAEISLGAITTMEEAISWMRYTYLWVRMQRNPTAYGFKLKEVMMTNTADEEDDGSNGSNGGGGGGGALTKRLTSIILEASKVLGSSGMISYNGSVFKPKSIGRIASSFYLSYQTIVEWGKLLRPGDHVKGEEHLLSLAGKASEFEQLRVRDEEVDDIEYLGQILPLVKLGTTKAISDGHHKASLLMQAYIARIDMSSSFSLQNDLNYIAQNGSRILRALFEVVRSMHWAPLALVALRVCQIWERRCFHHEHPLLPLLLPPSQFTSDSSLPKFVRYQEILSSVPRKDFLFLKEKEIARLLSLRLGDKPDQEILRCITSLQRSFPLLTIKDDQVDIRAITSWLQITLTVKLESTVGLGTLKHSWWLWVEDLREERIIYCLQLNISTEQRLTFIIPRLETGYRFRFINDNLSHCQTVRMVTFNGNGSDGIAGSDGGTIITNTSTDTNKNTNTKKYTYKNEINNGIINEIGPLQKGKNYLIMAPLRADEFSSLQKELSLLLNGIIIENGPESLKTFLAGGSGDNSCYCCILKEELNDGDDTNSNDKDFYFVSELSDVKEVMKKKKKGIVAFSPPLKVVEEQEIFDEIISFDTGLRSSPLRIEMEPLPTDRRNCLPAMARVVPLLAKKIFNAVREFSGPSLIVCPSREISLRLQRSLKTILLMEISSSSSSVGNGLFGDIVVMEPLQLGNGRNGNGGGGGGLINITYLTTSTTNDQFLAFRRSMPPYGMIVLTTTLGTDVESDILSSSSSILQLLLEARDKALMFVNEDMIPFYRDILEEQRIVNFK